MSAPGLSNKSKIGLGLIFLNLIFWVTLYWNVFWSTPILNFRIPISRDIVVICALHLFLIVIILRKQIARNLIHYFTAAGSPVNLAVFRIVFFSMWVGWQGTKYIQLSRTPVGVRVAPDGLEWVMAVVPMNPEWMTTAVMLFKVACGIAMIGFFTRTSCFLAALLGLYVYGLPQFMGKVGHTHHVIWFMLLLASSRCGDALSVDALISAWRRGGRGQTAPPGQSVIYALPLRFIWLLFGVLYFFPGFWKLWEGGLDWIFSNNLKNYLYYKWSEHPGWQPFFRLDQHPFLFKSAAFGVVVFEISFFFLVFSERLRTWLALAGLLFHKMTNLLMRIDFNTLQTSYVAFFDWHGILQWLGKALVKKERVVVIEANNPAEIRRIAVLRALDVFGRTQYIDRSGNPEKRPEHSPRVKPYATILIGTVLILGNIYCGFLQFHSWPFSCYPTFASLALEPYIDSVNMVVVDANGDPILLRKEKIRKVYSNDKMRMIYMKILSSETASLGRYRLKSLWELWAQHDSELKEKAKEVKFYYEILSIVPEDQPKNPVFRRLLWEMKL